MPSPRRSFAIAALTMVSGIGLSGCATTEYVDEQIALVNGRVSALEARVNEVSNTANSALQGAQAAAGEAQRANLRIDELSGQVQGLDQRVTTLETSRRRPRN